jgi:serine/threonine protein kinase
VEPTSCPTENEFLARVAGVLAPERAAFLDTHVDVCASCRMALADAATVLTESDGERASSATFAQREIIADRYIVVSWLATGGMGEVYEVHDTWIDERIALKTIVAAIADDPHALSRLKAEVRIARRVTHANVCRVYDIGFHQRGEEQIAFLTMELLKGVTLRHLLAEKGPVTYETARPLILQMARALRHAHAAGIVHRDFKSDNVMVEDAAAGVAPRVVVMDFGLARQSLVGLTQPLTPQSRTVFGTLDYMSPEQVMGRPATPASDLYSLGVVIYELLTGRLPFLGESPLARALLRVTEKPPPLTKALPSAGEALEDCVSRCLQLEPEARFATVDELLGALGAQDAPPAAPRVRRSHLVVPSFIVGAAVAAFAVRAHEPLASPPPPAATAPALEARREPSFPVTNGAVPPKVDEETSSHNDTPRMVEHPTTAPKPPVSRRGSVSPARGSPVVLAPPDRSATPNPESQPARTAREPGREGPMRHEGTTGAGDDLLNPFTARRPVVPGQQPKQTAVDIASARPVQGSP